MLKELIDKFYLEQQRDKGQTRFYISDAGKCSRQIFFKFKNVPREPMEARMLRVFEHGEYLHRNIFNILYRLKIGITTEVNIPNKEIISGRADAIICVNNENYVLDIKSMNSMVFRKLTEPKVENVYQLQLYLYYFNIKKGILLYIDKDQQEIKEFVVDYDKNIAQSLIANFTNLKSKIESDIIPLRLASYPVDWQCRYCQFKEICEMGEDGEMSWEAFKKQIEAENQTG